MCEMFQFSKQEENITSFVQSSLKYGKKKKKIFSVIIG